MNKLMSAEIRMTSLDIAEITGKEHKNIMRDIRKEIEELGENIGRLIFEQSTYLNSQNKEQPCYTFGKKGAMQLALKYDAGTRYKVIERIEELERQIAQPTQPKTQAELIAMMAQLNVEQEKRLALVEQENETIKHRLDNLDRIDTFGDLQQRLNKMVKRYAWESGVNMGTAWKRFDQAFNTAYRTNLTARRNNYADKHGFKSITRPQYLSLVNQLEDAIRVVDKMMNKKEKGAS